jgi:hypothetical protein
MQTTGAVLLAVEPGSVARQRGPAQGSRSAYGLLYLAAVLAESCHQEHRQSRLDIGPAVAHGLAGALPLHACPSPASVGGFLPGMAAGPCRLSITEPAHVIIRTRIDPPLERIFDTGRTRRSCVVGRCLARAFGQFRVILLIRSA